LNKSGSVGNILRDFFWDNFLKSSWFDWLGKGLKEQYSLAGVP